MTAALKLVTPTGYKALDTVSVIDYLARVPGMVDRIGGNTAEWQATEVGDGNLNLVFIVRGANKALVVKQTLPYVRLVGESWPLPLSRAHFEHLALAEEYQHAPQYVPATYHYDEAMALTVMEYLSPHIIMRKGLIDGVVYPKFAAHMGEYLAKTLFHTSDLALSALAKRAKMAPYLDNNAMCKITEDLIFDEPFFAAPMNRCTPGLAEIAKSFQTDAPLKRAAQAMKWRFLNAPEALCHGDLHTGSIMLTADDTRAIDPEFAFYGPMGFDIGMLLANLLMAYYAQDGYGDRPDYKKWILSAVAGVWENFAQHFTQLWQNRAGEAYKSRVITDAAAPQERLAAIWQDTVGFCGVEIIRRILGLAHVAELESITDEAVRAKCEARALLFAREILVNPSSFTAMQKLLAVV